MCRADGHVGAKAKLDAFQGESSAHAEFVHYLEAKILLDARSLNRDVRQASVERLARKSGVSRWLDVGTGTGAMVRRLVKTELRGSWEITALDRDAALLNVASAKLADELAHLRYDVRSSGDLIEARTSDGRLRIAFRCCGMFDFEPRPASYDLVTAHAFMDIVPVGLAVSRFAAWLAPAGLLYATLNYDGDTALLPQYGDADFEESLLAAYDASMEERRVEEQPTGGARSGRRLLSALCGGDFDVLAYGSSDWNITPRDGAYRERDADVLRALLVTIRTESERNPAIDPGRLARWCGSRSAQLERGELGMIVRQLDIAAVRRQRLTALT